MTVKTNDLPTNNLYINEIEQNTSPNSLELGSGKEGEYTYSKTLAKLLRRFVRVVVPDQDQVYYSDIEKLDTLMLWSSRGDRSGYTQAPVPVTSDSMGDYFNPYLGTTAFAQWDEEEFKKRKTSKQSISGFRRLYNDCETIKEALKSLFK